MTQEPQDKLRATLVRAAREVERLRGKVAALETAASEPIAVIGVGLQLPGEVRDLESLWALLEDRGDVVEGIPKERWSAEQSYDPDPESVGKTYVRDAAFISGLDLFDPEFFKISPREAKSLDPQHRLLLEAAWRALEHARVVPHSLVNSRTGVYVGVGPSDYSLLQRTSDADTYATTGTHTSFAAGRIAYHLGLQGPAVSVDTACSSSLVALHLACNALRVGECGLALAAGVQALLAPEPFIALSRTRALAPDGRSKTFSASADGYGRGEGVVVLALERLSDAKAKGRRILALVRGSAVNHDGMSSGITAPNGTSQQQVLRAALEDARLEPGDIDFVECHGTGTKLGDPIEVQALAAVYGQGRPVDAPLLLGALKTNIGHLESAAGLAGVAKVISAMGHRALPPTIHTRPRNPHIDWERLAVQVVDELRPWRRRASDRPLRSGVSAFGLSGTNAHVILEEAPASELSEHSEALEAPAALPFLLSARNEAGLERQASQLREYLETRRDISARDLAFSLATTRSHFEHRACVVPDDVSAALDDLAHHRVTARIVTGIAKGTTKLAVLFTGQGSQRLGMGRELRGAYPKFREVFDDICVRFDRLLETPLAKVVFADDATELDQTAYTQPALFAVEVALFRLFESWGVKPDLLLGHSIGELAAAHIAGVFSLDDACKLVAARGRLMQALAPGGAMVSIRAREDEVVPVLAQHPGVDIAGLNGPMSTVVSGDEAPVLALARHFEAEGRKTKQLTVSHAFHSHRMDAMLGDFEQVAASITYHPAKIRIISNVSGKLATPDELGSANYWVRHVRAAVRFLDGVRTLEAQNIGVMLELGPHGVLSSMAAGCLSEASQDTLALLPALRRDRPETETLALALGGLHCHGVAVDWPAYFAPFAPQRVDLPTYAFQRQRYWLDTPEPIHEENSEPVDDFWAAVHRDDLDAVTGILALDDNSHPALAELLPKLSAWHREHRRPSFSGWTPVAIDESPVPSDRRPTWLIASTPRLQDSHNVRALLEALETSGIESLVITLDASVAREDITPVLRDRLGTLAPDAVISLLAFAESPALSEQTALAGLTLNVILAQSLIELSCSCPTWLVTRGAVSVNDAAPAMTSGLAQSLSLEHPDLWSGFLDISSDAGIALFSKIPHVISIAGERRQFSLGPEGLFARVIADDASPDPSNTTKGTRLISELRLLSEQERVGRLLHLTLDQLARVLGYQTPESIAPEANFASLGLDSLMALELRKQLSLETGLKLRATLAYDHPSPRQLVIALLGALQGQIDQADEASVSDDELQALLRGLSVAKLERAGLLTSLLEIANDATPPAASPGVQDKFEDLADEDLLSAADLLIGED
jgi:acyl transferase domain-containing protein